MATYFVSYDLIKNYYKLYNVLQALGAIWRLDPETEKHRGGFLTRTFEKFY